MTKTETREELRLYFGTKVYGNISDFARAADCKREVISRLIREEGVPGSMLPGKKRPVYSVRDMSAALDRRKC